MKYWVYFSEIYEEICQGIYLWACRNKIRYQEEKKYEIEKWQSYVQLLARWMHIRQSKFGITLYLEKYACKKIAIYGMGEIGKLCVDEFLESETVKISYAIDRNKMGNYRGIPVILPEEVEDNVDAIIITPIYCYMEIADFLCRYSKAKLISMEDIIAVLDEQEEV